MRDVVYFAVTIGFFALMLAYVAWCARLGRGESSAEARAEAVAGREGAGEVGS